MKDEFVIDENIVINAWRGSDAKGQRAHNERIFLNAFIPSNKKMLSTVNIHSKYRELEKINLEDDKYEDVGIKKWFLDRLLDSERCPIVDGLKVPKYIHVKDDDSEFVYLAITRDGNLITVDRRMWEEIKDEKLETKIKYFDIVQAIPLVI